MTVFELLTLIAEENVLLAPIAPQDVPVDYRFRRFCEQNLCGQYGTNYACPPICGTPEALHAQLLAEAQVFAVETVWNIGDYSNRAAIDRAKTSHNAALLRMMRKLKAAGFEGFCAGNNGCPVCEVCSCEEHRPCAHPEERINCLSSYCVDVAELAKRCRLDFAWTPDTLYLFGFLAFHQK